MDLKLPVIPEASAFLEPATPVPVSAQVGSLSRDDDEVAHAWLDRGFAPRALVPLYGLIRLNGVHGLVVTACKLRKEAVWVEVLGFGHAERVERMWPSLSCSLRLG